MRMFLLTTQELWNFLTAQGIAAALCLLYDFFESLKTDNMKKTAENFFDAAIWFLLSAGFFTMWQKFLAGEFRWYTALAFVIACVLYYLTIHRPVFSAYCIIVKKIYSFFNIIFKFLLTVCGFLGKITMYLSKVCKKIYYVDYEGSYYEKNQRKT